MVIDNSRENLSSLTDAVYVSLNVRPFVRPFDTLIHHRKVIINDHVNLENVNPSGDDIGGNQNLVMVVYSLKGR
jgi:hypothetical protein